jgi:hypothetical protein
VVAAADSVVRDAPREVRVARFDVRQEPYTIVADVELPPPPDSATLRVKVAVDAIPLEARVTCAEILEGSRMAAVSVRTPAWVNVRIGTVSQSPEVCAAPPRTSAFALGWASLRRLVSPRVVVGAGRAWGTDGHALWAVFIGAGITL